MRIKLIFMIPVILLYTNSFAQDSILIKMLEDSISITGEPGYVKSTFNGTTLVNLQTIEQPARNVLQFMIMHRFGRINEGAYQFFGLDNATLRLGLDFGVTERFSVGIGRSSLDKTLDGSLKYKLLRQGENKLPVSVNLFASIARYTLKYSDKPYLKGARRNIYTTQVIAARKFNKRLSIQVTPTLLHFNLVPTVRDKNNVWALGLGGRYKVTKRTCIIAEYSYLPSKQLTPLTALHNSFSTGIELETGGHVFQLVFTNSDGMVEPYYMAKTTGRWGKGDIFFGFNVSRVFNLKNR